MARLPDPLPIEPIAGPLDATVQLPGSKSITNRALICAALASGTSELTGALEADDTYAMVEGLRALGIGVDTDWPAGRITVRGCAGRPPVDVALVDARLSGTTSRFLLPVAALATGTTRVDGGIGLRARPMGPAIDAIRALGARVTDISTAGHLPVELADGPLAGGAVALPGDTSSQFLSGLLLAGPAMRTGLTVRLTTELVSRPYVEMTVAVMAAFGVSVEQSDDRTWVVSPAGYRAAAYAVEPDASAASYCFGTAAIVGGRVTVPGLGTASLQGDLDAVRVLGSMGAEVDVAAGGVTVTGDRRLRGVEVDLSQMSDVAQTLAVVAAFADGPSRFTGIGFIRGKETDRVGNVVTELRRAGIGAVEEPDGYLITPGPVRPATIETYGDHRMAMAFALLGLRAPGIRIADPGCVAKTFPGYWAMLDGLRSGSASGH
ncbi:MAG: 3-phosphoshikimate 1-carboxyvinyltransferase [Acidimicrobiales bacterium]|nr:3-phosphoshikimate 1-carboxyvinyltransferase [Acidimicrobiales bacterium]